jgi:hypothetical protein
MPTKKTADTAIVDCTEQKRLNEAREAGVPWKKWGPYLSERQWGTVREDYSADGNAWDYFSHDQSRSRAYRWGEDGLGGISDDKQRLCFALALWNERDPILKERAFGLTNSEGNHGEDVKEYYFYVDSTPTHSYMKYLYKYPQREFPYRDLLETNRRRTKEELEYELLDTGIFDDDRYLDVFLEYAKAGPDDILIRVSVHNRGKEAARLQLLPTLWFRNTWSWGDAGDKPGLREKGGAIVASHPELGDYTLSCGGAPELLFTENETNAQRLWGQPNPTPYVKDAFHRYVISGERDAVNPGKTGTKAAARYVLEVPAGGSKVVQLRLTKGPAGAEYPWYAAWDLAFHTIALSLVDFDFAKEQLLLMLRSLYSHPNGQMPAYEWNFSDVNPPVHAWATLFLDKMEKNLGREDVKFLERSFQGLMLNFNWWVNRKAPQGRNVFAGGFLGLDNIGVFDRSAPLPTGGSLEQADGTAWMAFYCQNMLDMAVILADHDPAYQEVAFKFLENFIWIAYAMDKVGEHHPFVFHVAGQEYRVEYLPGDSNSGMFGGNSNWRGPIWMPVNALIVWGLLNPYGFYGDDFKVECLTSSGNRMTLFEIAKEISRRLESIFLRDASGRRPVYGGAAKFQDEPHWRDPILFYEYFHGDNGAGIGASHQTGWTGLVARLIDLFGRMTAQDALETPKEKLETRLVREQVGGE